MATHWAIDLGTANTTICEDRSGSPRVVNLPDLSVDEPITQTPLIPSAVCVLDDRAGTVLIGEKAVAYNWDGRAPGFVGSFKRYLGAESPGWGLQSYHGENRIRGSLEEPIARGVIEGQSRPVHRHSRIIRIVENRQSASLSGERGRSGSSSFSVTGMA